MFNWQSAVTGNTLRARRQRAPGLNDLTRVHAFKSEPNIVARFVGPPKVVAEHWFKIRSKDGKVFDILKPCYGFNPKTGTVDKPCPYCDATGRPGQVRILQNAIIRSAQQNEPKRLPKPMKDEIKAKPVKWAEGFEAKLKGSKTEGAWTPVSVLSLSASNARKIASLAANNRKKSKKTGKLVSYPPEHPLAGFDIAIKYEASAAPAQQYTVLLDQPTKLSAEEQAYPIWNLDAPPPPPPIAEAIKDAKQLMSKLVVENQDGGMKNASKAMAGDDDDEEDDENGGDETTEKVKKKKKKKKTGDIAKSSSTKKKKRLKV